MQRTIYNVQYLRFLAAASVLFSHAASLLIPFTSTVWRVPWTAGVDLFFVISGFIMTWLTGGQFGNRGAPTRYLLRRIVRIVPPYWFFTIVMVVVVLVAPDHVHNTRAGAVELLTSFLFIPWPRADGGLYPIVSQGWTLNFEAFFYVSFALALASRRGLALLVGAFIALTAVHALVPSGWFVLRFHTSPIILEFAGGMILGKLHLRGVRLPPFAPAFGIVAAALLFLAVRHAGIAQSSFDDWGFGRVLLFGLPALVLAAGFILTPDLWLGRAGEILRFGGDASYTLYLSHPLCINAVVLVGRAVGCQSPWILLATACASAILFAMLFYRFVEAPVTRRLGQSLGLKVARGPASVAP